MISIRENVFESNSSSCHSMTVTASKDKLEKFNKGELFYCYIPDSTRGDDFWTAEELCGALIILGTKGVENIQFGNGYGQFTDGDFENIWNSRSEIDELDKENYLRWFFANLKPEMIEWAFNSDPSPKYISKKLIKLTLETLIEENFYSPLCKVNDLFDVDSKHWSIDSIYEMDNSDVRLNKETKQLEPYTAGKDQYEIQIEFRN